MSRVIRRIGPLALWQYAVCLAVLPFYFPIAWLVEPDTWSGWLLPRGVIVLLLGAVLLWRRPIADFIDKVALLEPEGEAPRNIRAFRVERHFHVFMVSCIVSGLLAILQSLSMVESAGMAYGLLAYLLGWHLCLFIPLMMWARSRSADRPPPAKRGTTPEIADMWIVPPDEDDDPSITVAVKVDGIRNVGEVVAAVLGREVLPPATHGDQRWSVVVGGAAVGELTQTWHHPHWWPPIEWIVSPSSQFEGGRVGFRPSDSERP